MQINYIEDLYLKGSYQVFADETPIGFLNVLMVGALMYAPTIYHATGAPQTYPQRNQVNAS